MSSAASRTINISTVGSPAKGGNPSAHSGQLPPIVLIAKMPKSYAGACLAWNIEFI
jgi:hypothetical protein